MKGLIFFTMAFISLLLSQACGVNQENKVVKRDYSHRNEKIESYVEHLIERQGIPGLALTILEGSSITYQQYFNYASIEHQVPITGSSIFRLYSLTKPFIAVAIFNLIEQGSLKLEDNVGDYIQDIPESWRNLNLKHLLSHSSGLPDMAPITEFEDLTEKEAFQKIRLQEFKFSPGSRYDYNQTNFWLLKRIIETVSDQTLTEYIVENQFGGISDAILFSSDSRDIVLNRVTPYFPFIKPSLTVDLSYLQGDYAYAMNGMNISMNEFVKWDNAFRRDELLMKSEKRKMWEPYIYSESDKKFAYGWDVHEINNIKSYGFSGSFVTCYRTIPEKDISIIFLSNGLTHWYNIENIVNHIAGIIDSSLIDKDNLLFETLLQASLDKGNRGFIAAYENLASHTTLSGIDIERIINDVGYFLVHLKELDKAIGVFRYNVDQYATSWNAYDSLAEALEIKGDIRRAIEQYKLALTFLPKEDENHYRILNKINDLQSQK